MYTVDRWRDQPPDHNHYQADERQPRPATFEKYGSVLDPVDCQQPERHPGNQRCLRQNQMKQAFDEIPHCDDQFKQAV